jgi:Xaa-Pro dipeptidase
VPSPEETANRRARLHEVETKLALLRDRLDVAGRSAVALTTQASVAWLTAGLTNPIDRSDPGSLLWLVVHEGGVAAVTTTVEGPRLEAEAGLDEIGFTLVEVPWYEPDAFARAAEGVAGLPWAQLAPDEDELTALRLRLLPSEQERLARLGADAAGALEAAVSAWVPGERDLDVQARVGEYLERVDAIPVCLIVGGDERVERFRHPLAAGVPVEKLIMAVVVAMRDGLHAAATRFASAGPLSESVRAAFDASFVVEAAMLDAHRLDAPYGAVLETCDEAYAAVGHPGAWQEHYQGGPVGYRQREFELAPSQRESRWYTQSIEVGHAVAWNPSVAGGGKVEDTFLVEAGGLRRLTDTGNWPAIEVWGGRTRCGVLDIAR